MKQPSMLVPLSGVAHDVRRREDAGVHRWSAVRGGKPLRIRACINNTRSSHGPGSDVHASLMGPVSIEATAVSH